MKIKALMPVALLLALAPALLLLPARAGAAAKPAAETPAAKSSPQNLAESAAAAPEKPLCDGHPCDEATPRVVVSVPPSAPQPWSLHQRIAWGAILLLAVVGYIGVMMGLSLLRKIERQTRAAEEAATAAAESSRAALLQAQAIIDSTRPWLLITPEPAINVENGFRVLLTNHGKSPARIESLSEQLMICTSEEQLPAKPTFQNDKHDPQTRSIILLPGESLPIRSFSRDEVQALCESPEQYARVESWKEKIYLYGRVLYRDLAQSGDRQPFESNWCCWYIHGQQKSGMVLAGPRSYQRHS